MHMSAFGGKADMAFCESPLSRSLLGVKRTSHFAAQMSAFDPKRTLIERSRVDLGILLQRLEMRLEPNLRNQRRHHRAANHCCQQDCILLLIDDVIG